MTYTLHHFDKSFNCFKVRAVLNFLGLEYKLEEVEAGQHKSPEWISKNPHGRFPILQLENNTTLWESDAIISYLAETHASHVSHVEAGFFPKETFAKANMNQWLFWEAHHFAPTLNSLAFEILMKPELGMGEADTAKVESLTTSLERELNTFNNVLEGQTWTTGETMSLADISIASNLIYFEKLGINLEKYAFINKWWNQLNEQTWFTKALPKF